MLIISTTINIGNFVCVLISLNDRKNILVSLNLQPVGTRKYSSNVVNHVDNLLLVELHTSF